MPRCDMRTGSEIEVAAADTNRLEAMIAARGSPPTQEATRWTVRAMATAVGIAASLVVKIWHDHGLAPHRWHSSKLSNDTAFAEKLHDVVGLYVAPPAHAIVLSVDESQIQALDRTQPGLPLECGRGATMTHDYQRNCAATLFAAFGVLDGSVIGRNMQRHRHQEFIRFLNAVESFFAKLTRRRLKSGVFHSVVDLPPAINRFIKVHNQQPRPFVWRADPDEISAAVRRGHQTLESIH